MIIGCGDLPYPYLENIVSFLNIPLFYVPGNHDPTHREDDPKSYAEGGSNLDQKLVRFKNFLIGGLGGCIPGPDRHDVRERAALRLSIMTFS